MKKTVFTVIILVGTLLQISYNNGMENKVSIANQHWIEAKVSEISPEIKNTIVRLLVAGFVTYASGEILVDAWYRYLRSKEVVLQCAEELRRDAGDILTENEIKFWSFIQGLSRVPCIWWRELCATALTIAIVQSSRKLLLTN